MPPPPSPSPSCPFCRIASSYPPHHPSPLSVAAPSVPEIGDSGHAHLILSTKSVLAFLDIMPLTRGHVLLATRRHYEKIDELDVETSREIGQWLPVLSRVIMKTVFGDEESGGGEAHWNVVQNNGARAAQQVDHVHFHIVPRPAVHTTGRFAAAQGAFAMFGRGQRHDLDDDEAEELARTLGEELAREVRRVRDVEGVDLGECSFGQRGLGKL